MYHKQKPWIAEFRVNHKLLIHAFVLQENANKNRFSFHFFLFIKQEWTESLD